MSMRTFMDAEGKEWQVFDVVPRIEERRTYDRRLSQPRNSVSDDRRGNDRRVTVGRRSPLAAVNSGWLCFERAAGTERRRLMPIPADWRKCGDGTLDGYCREAREVRRDAVSLGEFAGRDRR
ncbi:MAG: hypothetical protein ABI442_11455 [Gemmatimonadaceae bacterium]